MRSLEEVLFGRVGEDLALALQNHVLLLGELARARDHVVRPEYHLSLVIFIIN